MKIKYYLAIDIGASSGRHILGHVENGKLFLEEIYRFSNGYTEKNGHFYWDIDELFKNIVSGIKKCNELGKIPESIGIDTWGVDYALLDENDNLIDGILAYRDERTISVMDELYGIISKEELFSRTGIAEHSFNTIFQLYEDKKSGRLNHAASMLFVPCYLNYLLTGVKKNEYTFATTTGLINVASHDWDYEITEKLSLPKKLFSKLYSPCETVGYLKPELAGFSCRIVLPASHDTASAVIAVPALKSPMYISSGTWSLMGIETQTPYTNKKSELSGFTNEGGIDGTIRYLKNIMGLWIIQSVKHELGDKYSYAQLMQLAQNSDYVGISDVNSDMFLAPKSMITAVNEQLISLGFPMPSNIGDTLRAIYHGLAVAYASAAKETEEVTGQHFDTIYIVGGGSKDSYLNQLTAEYSDKKIVTGITEATAIGNIAVQLLADKQFYSVEDVRVLIANSFELTKI